MKKYRCRVMLPEVSEWKTIEQRSGIMAASEFFFVFDNLPCVRYNNVNYATIEIEDDKPIIVSNARERQSSIKITSKIELCDRLACDEQLNYKC